MPEAIQTSGLRLIYDTGANQDFLAAGFTFPVFATGRYNYVALIWDVASVSGGTFNVAVYARLCDENGNLFASGTTAAQWITLNNFTAAGTKLLTMHPAGGSHQALVAAYWGGIAIFPFFQPHLVNSGTATSILGRLRIYARE